MLSLPEESHSLRAEPTLLRCASGIERQHRLHRYACEPAEQPCVPSQAARWAAYGFPLVVLAVLTVAGLLVMVPMEKPAG